MGKASKFKQIRKMAATMPALKILKPKSQIITGAQLIERGTTELNGDPVDPKQVYKESGKVEVSANHVNEMKRLFKKFGQRGILGYQVAVDNQVKKLAGDS